MAEAPKKKVKMITLKIQDRTLLYSSYIKFFKTGGIFVSTKDTFTMGEEVLLVLEIMEHSEKFPLRTHVAWLSAPNSTTIHPKGIGLAFGTDEVGQKAKTVIETNLAGLLDNPRPTYTL